jgi:phage shock protein E
MFRVKLFIAAIALVSCSAAAPGCAAHPSQPSRPLGQPFDLKAGTSAVLTDGLRLTFERVRTDSRCPLDALCIQAGEAIVVLTLAQSAAAPVEQELRTTPAFSEASYLSYVVKLVALAPYPRSTQPIRPEEYVATLTVDRR